MNGLLAVVLLSLHFTAPANAPVADTAGRLREAALPVKAYAFYRSDAGGMLVPTPGYADSNGHGLLSPHVPGTRETVWLLPAAGGGTTTIYVLSLGTNGAASARSNGCVIGHIAHPKAATATRATRAAVSVPMVRQTRERCGEAALTMVLRYYGAPPAALHEVDAAYDPVMHGSLITDLAKAARRAGYEATVATLTADSLVELLQAGVPPILLYQNGSGPLTVRHFGVVTGWNADRGSFTLQDGGTVPRVTRRSVLSRQWETAGSLALIVRPLQP